MLFRTLDAIIGSPTRVRILRALIGFGHVVSGNEARLLAGVRSKSAMRSALDDLTELGVLMRDDTRRIQLFRINPDHDLLGPLTRLFEAEARRSRSCGRCSCRSSTGGAVRGHTLSITVFGSNARGDARPSSDLDILAVTEAQPHVERVLEVLIDAIPDVQRRFGLRLSPLVLEKARVRERYVDGDPLMQNVLSDGRTPYGTHFHEMVDAW
ncbi:MAG TPA: nucleotidyltransferase domain-containing protein [Longimicrobium sp.]|nr:nucleotidyltransferase domain-containing protein [Longimicrobium sp.]